MKGLSLLLGWMALASAVYAGEPGWSEVLSGNAYPLSVTFKELSPEWRKVTVRGNVSVSGNTAVNVTGNSNGATSQNNLLGALSGSQNYLTKGQLVQLSGRAYLVGYHLPSTGLDIPMILQALVTKTPPKGKTLNPESILPLSLLDLSSIGSLDDIRAFDATAEIAESESAMRSIVELFKAEAAKNEGGKGGQAKPDPKKTGPARQETEAESSTSHDTPPATPPEQP